jgi:glucose-6-phosphate isomerase
VTSRPAVGLPVVELGGGSPTGPPDREGPVAAEGRRVAAELAADTVASRITDADPSAWGREAADGLGWAALPHTSRPLIGQVNALREAFRVDGAARVLLVGDSRWTLGAEVLARGGERTAEPDLLQVLDTPDPGVVAHALAGDLSGTVLVITDPAGTTEWVAAVQELLTDAVAEEIGPRAAAERTVVLTEAGSPLDERARAAGSVVITTERDVPGAFSVLGAPGLVPAGLAGAPVGGILDDARAAVDLLTTDDPENPALLLAGVLVACGNGVVRIDPALAPPALAEWVAMLVAAAGATPVLLEEDEDGLPTGPTIAPATAKDPTAAPDDLTELLGPGPRRMPDDPDTRESHTTARESHTWADESDTGDRESDTDGPDSDGSGEVVSTGGPLGAELLLWQYATAAAARLLDGDPFTELPAAPADPLPERSSDGIVTAHADDRLEGSTVDELLQALVDAVPPGGHLALSAWLDPTEDASIAVLRGELARRAGVPVTFGWGPRDRGVLAPFQRDDPRPGAVCLLTGGPPDDVVPGTGPDTSRLALTEAGSAAAEVAARGVPVLRLHLVDRVSGLVLLARAAQALRPRWADRGRTESGGSTR